MSVKEFIMWSNITATINIVELRDQWYSLVCQCYQFPRRREDQIPLQHFLQILKHTTSIYHSGLYTTSCIYHFTVEDINQPDILTGKSFHVTNGIWLTESAKITRCLNKQINTNQIRAVSGFWLTPAWPMVCLPLFTMIKTQPLSPSIPDPWL